ncbi:adenylate/guanylate cyclase domain-containing protein [Mesorhizobium sp. M0199]|uniref:adenylate/guanylate cyclase domain-containing protein n=1 Tax=Mesorhizobium sp. M0199 TaxID=2956911 RepID=UPI00333AFE83
MSEEMIWRRTTELNANLCGRHAGTGDPPVKQNDRPGFPAERGLPIAWLLPLVLTGLVLVAVIPVLLLGYLGARDNTDRLMRDRSELVLDVLVDRIKAHLDPVRGQLAYVADAVKRGALDTRDEAAMDFYIAGALAGTPQVNDVAFARPDFTVRRTNRQGSESYEETVNMPPTVRQSLMESRTDRGLRWFGPYWSTILSQPVLGLRASLIGPAGDDKGVLVAVVSVAELSRFLAEVANDLDQTPFVLVGREHVLAHPALVGTGASAGSGPGRPLPGVEAFEDGVLARIWTREANPLTSSQPFRRSQGHWSWFEPNSFESNAYVYRAISDYGGVPWTVGFHYPGTETRRERWIVVGIGLGGLALLALALTTAILVGRRLGQPMLGLAKAVARVEALDFAGARTLPRGAVREINQAAAAIERMAAGLGWFETYLPKTLVRRLMAAGPGSQMSETREVTVMFTDLENYTGYSRARPAAEVVSYLNDLLAQVGPIIEMSGGTIDKYIGDSVMAFWGAPEEQPDHASAACRAAFAIAHEVEAFNAGRRAEGLHACRMRIGLHTGPVAVGNVGFAGRVDYTIVGQTVNLAQALEQSGRQVTGQSEVVVLVSEATARRAGDDLTFVSCPEINASAAIGALRMNL